MASFDARLINEDEYVILDVPAHPSEAQTINLPSRPKPTYDELKNSRSSIEPLLRQMQETLETRQLQSPIFHANLNGSKGKKTRNLVYNAFISGIPIEDLKYFDCTCCRMFARKYGDLCVVANDGKVLPLFWPETTVPYFQKSLDAILNLFRDVRVSNVFECYSDKTRQLGTPKSLPTGWTHFSGNLDKIKLSEKSMKAQDTTTSYMMLERILRDYTPSNVALAKHMICSDLLSYATSHKPAITWLSDTMSKLSIADAGNVESAHESNETDESFLAAKTKRSDKATDVDNYSVAHKNLVNRYSREAWVGCLSSLRGGIIGTLLDNIAEGESEAVIESQWNVMAEPIAYLRPTAAPSVGNIEQAAKKFAEMGYSPKDLARIYMTVDQVPQSAFLWCQASSLKDNSKFNDKDREQTISFRSFALKVLPEVASMQIQVGPLICPYFFTKGMTDKPFFAFSTPTNTSSWYTWNYTQFPAEASLTDGWHNVSAVVSFPHMWEQIGVTNAFETVEVEKFKFRRHGIRFMFTIPGIREKNPMQLGLFPTLLKSEFHEVRKTIEDYSQRETIQVPEDKTNIAGGMVFAEGGESGTMFVRILTKTGQRSKYKIMLFD